MIDVIQDELSPGRQYGCLTVVHYPFYAKRTAKSDYLCKCQCECGAIHYVAPKKFASPNPNLQVKSCPLKEPRKYSSLPRVEGKYYAKDLVGTSWETLDILECIDTHWEDRPHFIGRERCVGSEVAIHKLYKCQCRLCHKDLYFKSSDFDITNSSHGPHAKKGYFSNAYCSCHATTSFQWATMKILVEYDIPHIAENSFTDLLGTDGGKLRFDFAVFDASDKNHIVALIECQGPQHTEDIYGQRQYEKQLEYDKAKVSYASEHGIPLIQIPYSDHGYEEIKAYLTKHSILTKTI